MRHLGKDNDSFVEAIDSFDDILFVTHLGCLDGAAAAAIFLATGGNHRNIIGMFPDEPDDALRFIDLTNYTHVMFVDIAPRDPDTIPFLQKHGLVVGVLDHHHTNVETRLFEAADYYDMDMDRCGTKIMFDFVESLPEELTNRYLHMPFWQRLEKYRELARMVDIADRTDTPPDEMDILGMHMREVRDWWYTVTKLGSEPRWKNVVKDDFEAVQAAIRLRSKECDACLERVEMAETPEGVMAYVMGPSKHATFILKKVLRDNPEADFAVIMDAGSLSCSVRARPGVDATRVAQRFGGGGHKAASGFKLPWDPIRSTLLSMFEAHER